MPPKKKTTHKKKKKKPSITALKNVAWHAKIDAKHARNELKGTRADNQHMRRELQTTRAECRELVRSQYAPQQRHAALSAKERILDNSANAVTEAIQVLLARIPSVCQKIDASFNSLLKFSASLFLLLVPQGYLEAHPGLRKLDGHDVVVRADFDGSSRVALISGGGSGHEPAHVGYVGAGGLTAAVCGQVFASPSSDAVLAAIRAVAGECGYLLIVQRRTFSRRCLEAPDPSPSVGGLSGGVKKFSPGDWICALCNVHNFEFRLMCFTCGQRRMGVGVCGTAGGC